jgi:hypothetical protein
MQWFDLASTGTCSMNRSANLRMKLPLRACIVFIFFPDLFDSIKRSWRRSLSARGSSWMLSSVNLTFAFPVAKQWTDAKWMGSTWLNIQPTDGRAKHLTKYVTARTHSLTVCGFYVAAAGAAAGRKGFMRMSDSKLNLIIYTRLYE